jgi:hypothetical protein
MPFVRQRGPRRASDATGPARRQGAAADPQRLAEALGEGGANRLGVPPAIDQAGGDRGMKEGPLGTEAGMPSERAAQYTALVDDPPGRPAG